MKIYTTYCSGTKNPSRNLMPATERYISTRISKVVAKAQADGQECFILSGLYGLVHKDAMIPNYDYLLQSGEVSNLVKKVKTQLLKNHVTHFTYFTASLKGSATLHPYYNVVRKATRMANVHLDVVEVPAY